MQHSKNIQALIPKTRVFGNEATISDLDELRKHFEIEREV